MVLVLPACWASSRLQAMHVFQLLSYFLLKLGTTLILLFIFTFGHCANDISVGK